MTTNRKFSRPFCSLVAALLFVQIAVGQPAQISAIDSQPVEISTERTVAVTFPFSITSVDRGSQQILAQKAKGTQNVLLLKAAQKDFKPTSLIVITSDGALYSFDVSYWDQPNSLTVLSPRSAGTVQNDNDINENLIDKAIELAKQHPSHPLKRSKNGGMSATVEGLYIKDEFILLGLMFENESVIDYDVESIRMLVGDRKQVKRTASQLVEILPLKVSQELGQIKGSEQKSIVLVIPKMTLSKGKRFCVETTEKRGARKLRISLSAKQLRRLSAL